MAEPLTVDEQRSILPRLADHATATAPVPCTGLLLARLVATVEAERDRAERAEADAARSPSVEIVQALLESESLVDSLRADLAAAHNVIRNLLDDNDQLNDAREMSDKDFSDDGWSPAETAVIRAATADPTPREPRTPEEWAEWGKWDDADPTPPPETP